MADLVHDTLIEHMATGAWSGWVTEDVRAAIFLADTWTPDKSDDVLATILAAGAIEISPSGYARTALTSQAATLDGGLHRELLDSAVIDFGTLGSGEDFDTLVLYVFVTDDTDSWLVSTRDLGAQTTTNASATRFVPDTDGLFSLVQP